MDRQQAIRARARDLVEQNAALDVRAPDLGEELRWLNVGRPLSLAEDLRGRVVLVDFWTSGCVHCLHVQEDLRHLEARFADRPFTVVGCHSAKFPHEARPESVRQAVLSQGIEHPVVVDRDREIWRRYGVRAWPTLFLVSPEGAILGQVSGEGQRTVLEVLVEQALELYEERGALEARPLPLRPEALGELAQELRFPAGLALGPDGTLFVADGGHHRVLELDADGAFRRAFGCGRAGLVDGDAREARFHSPRGLALHRGALLVADTGNHALRRIDLESGRVTTLVGNGRPGYGGYAGSFAPGDVSLSSPWDLAVRGDEALVAMAGTHQIWRLDLAAGTLGVLAGDGRERRADGELRAASLAQPSGLELVGDVLYVADAESSSVRAIDLAAGTVSTPAGGAAEPSDLVHCGNEDGFGHGRRFQHPLGLGAHGAGLVVADTYNHALKALDPRTGEVRTLAGTGEPGRRDGRGDRATFQEPSAVVARGRALIVADTGNHRLRAFDLDTAEVRTLRTTGVPVPLAERAAVAGPVAAARDSAPLPELPGTVHHPAVRARLARGAATLRVRLALAEGEVLAPGAPSQYRVLPRAGLVAARSVSGAIREPVLEVALGVEEEGQLAVQVLYYPRAPDGTCRLRSAQWLVTLDVADRGPREVELADACGA